MLYLRYIISTWNRHANLRIVFNISVILAYIAILYRANYCIYINDGCNIFSGITRHDDIVFYSTIGILPIIAILLFIKEFNVLSIIIFHSGLSSIYTLVDHSSPDYAKETIGYTYIAIFISLGFLLKLAWRCAFHLFQFIKRVRS